MYYYELYGRTIKTDLHFEQLVSCKDIKKTDIEICQGNVSDAVLQKERDKCKYEFGEKISWIANKTCYIIAENGNKITYLLKKDGNLEYLKTYILGWGMSMLAMQLEIVAVHCSAVADEKGAVLIAGESGSGKSTVTSAFLEKGYRLMADDMAWVDESEDGVKVYPAYPYQKLCRNVVLDKKLNLDELIYIDEDKDKYLARYEGKFDTKPMSVKQFIMLGITDEENVFCKEVKGIDKFHIIVNNQFLRALLNKDRYTPILGSKCLKIASKIPVYCILRPRDRDTVVEVTDKIFGIMR